MNERYQTREMSEEDAPKDSGRRQFLKDAVIKGTALGVTTSALATMLKKLTQEDNSKDSLEAENIDTLKKEKIHGDYVKESERQYVGKTPLEQIEEFGMIKNLDLGMQAIHDRHYAYLTSTEKGKRDMEIATKNISGLNVKKVAEPFKKRGLPEELAYLIAIQETRGKPVTSWAGARGITGIMPATAKAMGFTPEDADNPYIAIEITARYLEGEKERFGDSVDMLLYAYNAGGGLFGFTENTPRDKRTPEHFYEYMREYMNDIFSKVVENGYYEHVIEKSDKNLTNISKRFNVPVYKIEQANNFKKDSVIYVGDVIKIPYDDLKIAAKILLRKPFEALRYAPEVKAKQKALIDSGMSEKIELSMRD